LTQNNKRDLITRYSFEIKSKKQKNSPNNSIIIIADLRFHIARTGASCLTARKVNEIAMRYIHFYTSIRIYP